MRYLVFGIVLLGCNPTGEIHRSAEAFGINNLTTRNIAKDRLVSKVFRECGPTMITQVGEIACTKTVYEVDNTVARYQCFGNFTCQKGSN